MLDIKSTHTNQDNLESDTFDDGGTGAIRDDTMIRTENEHTSFISRLKDESRRLVLP